MGETDRAGQDGWIERVLGFAAGRQVASTKRGIAARLADGAAIAARHPEFAQLHDQVRGSIAAAEQADQGGDADRAGFNRRLAANLLDRLALAAEQAAEAGSGGDPAARWSSIRQAWLASLNGIAQQLADLGRALEASGDTDFVTIAAGPLPEFAASFRERFDALDRLIIGGAELGGEPAAASEALGMVRDVRAMLGADAVVDACERNPLGVSVAIRDTLGPVLARAEALFAEAAPRR